jgi:biotin-(acetyl-CoA carboxylase) ligase
VIRGDVRRPGKALSIGDDGSLLVAYEDGQTEPVNSGEVSVRGMFGYA